ncbi:hypothetical protein HY969_04415 [Candidatus Kaiserbacteria bacterium]|nr:hypothetical protein [Candidatus Kaiserbacteria bacterium]
MNGPDNMDAGMTRRSVLKGVVSLGTLAAAPFLFAGLANARDCTGKRCGDWNIKPTPTPRENPEAIKKFKDDMNAVVSQHTNIQQLFEEMLGAYKLDAKRFSITMSPPGRAIQFVISEGGKEIDRFIIATKQLSMAYGVNETDPQLINKRGFQVLFLMGLQELRLENK